MGRHWYLVPAISILTERECILWLSYSMEENKKPEFCISLAMTCQVLLFKCSEQFFTVSRSYQKTVFFFSRGEHFSERENRLQAHKHSVDTLMFLAHCNGTQKNNGRVCNPRHALSHLVSKIRMCGLEGFVTSPIQKVTLEKKKATS